MSRKSVSSLEVAKHAGVSQATVSYVLNPREGQSISSATRQRVLDAVKELNYRPNRLANGVLRGKTNIIGVCASFLGSDFHSTVLKDVCAVLSDAGYHTFVSWSKRTPQEQAKEVDLLMQHRVDGIIYMPANDFPREDAHLWLRGIVAEGASCVIIDDRTNSDLVDCVVSDDVSGAALAVDHLISLGHKRIAFWSNVWDGSGYRDRLQGYANALAAAGIPVDPAICAKFPLDARDTARELHRFLRMPDPPTAFFMTNDITAMIVRHAAQDTGVRVPEDIAVVGYSNQDYAYFNDLTSISQNPGTMGRAAANLLLQRLQAPDSPTVIEYVPTELVVRGSTVPQPVVNRFNAVD
ncbi:MAG TPA: LacI family DNA-binding transcriptional regulator [Capsulimonadaceae bacterium]|jgi:DNA-binding LacI/PurR family transcriptional regulator